MVPVEKDAERTGLEGFEGAPDSNRQVTSSITRSIRDSTCLPSATNNSLWSSK